MYMSSSFVRQRSFSMVQCWFQCVVLNWPNDYLHCWTRIPLPTWIRIANPMATLLCRTCSLWMDSDPYPDLDPQWILQPFLGQISVPGVGSESVVMYKSHKVHTKHFYQPALTDKCDGLVGCTANGNGLFIFQTRWLHCIVQKFSHCTESDSDFNHKCQLQE